VKLKNLLGQLLGLSSCFFYVATWLVSSLVPFECPWRQLKGTKTAVASIKFIYRRILIIKMDS